MLETFTTGQAAISELALDALPVVNTTVKIRWRDAGMNGINERIATYDETGAFPSRPTTSVGSPV